MDHLALAVARSIPESPGAPALYNTYQAYLQGSGERLSNDLNSMAGASFGVKVVRGEFR